jgi:hypothetical protein
LKVIRAGGKSPTRDRRKPIATRQDKEKKKQDSGGKEQQYLILFGEKEHQLCKRQKTNMV